MKAILSLLLFGAGIAVGCSCVAIGLWGLFQLFSELPLSDISISLPSSQ